MEVLPDNIMLIDKPKGITSFDVIRVLRKKLALRLCSGRHGRLKIGHGGTLDPLASGLLIVGVGGGTKRLEEFLKLSKVYIAEVILGMKTDTGDMEGKVLEQETVSRQRLSRGQIEEVLQGMEGKIELLVPAYSAVKQRGVPLYKRARRGEKIELPRKKMEIKKIRLLNLFQEGKHMILTLEMEVGSGTYVRSVAEEIGMRLGVPAMVKDLRRIKIGKFDISKAQKLDDL